MATPFVRHVALGVAVTAAATAGACGDIVGEPGTHRQVVESDCVTCHRDEYEAATAPSHENVFPLECATCHETTAWTPASFDDHPWPLEGAHATTSCNACHVGEPPVYEGTPMECVACHRDEYDTSPFPGHDAFPTACETCHTTTAWFPATFQHDTWPLSGAHTAARCVSCHGDPPVYQGTPRECVGCHQDDYDRSPYPGHSAFPTTCGGCHTTAAWTPATGGHPNDRFPLTDPHDYDCNQCHNATLGPDYKVNPDCVGCHEGRHTRALLDPKHREVSGYPAGDAPPNFCLDCHPSGDN